MYLLARDETGADCGAIEVKPEVQTIGRSVNCALRITGPGVSRIHASVYLHQSGVVINDEGSANGVKVDGKAISGPTLITPSNSITLSGFTLWLQQAPAASADDAPIGAPEEQDTRLEPRTLAPPAGPRGGLLLVGRGGPYDGATLRIKQVLATVGRDDDNQVVLEDPSISRRHAQLRLAASGDRMTVLDLRSSNGTFLDGQRIKRAEVVVGSVLRFGDLAFSVQREGVEEQDKAISTSPRRRRLWIAIGSGALLTSAVVVATKLIPPDKPPPRKVSPEELLRKRQAQIQAVADAARRDMAKRDWSAAIVKIDEVLQKDPLNLKAKALRARALDELGHAKTFEQAQRFFALGNRENLEKARQFFTKIPASSVYAHETRYKLRTIDERIAEEHRVDGVSFCKARYYIKCYSSLCRYFELMPRDVAVPGEPGLRRRMAAVERRYRRRKTFTRCEAPRYLKRDTSQTGDDPTELLEDKYKNLAIREAITLYYQGKIDMALKEVAKLRERREMRPHLRLLEEVSRHMLIVRGKYQEAFSFIRQRKAPRADSEVKQLLAADAFLLPRKLTSFYRRDALSALGRLYGSMGAESFKVKSYADAFEAWRRGVEVDPANDIALNGLLQLEKTAEALLAEGRSLATQGQLMMARQKLSLARDICRDGQPLRKEAEAALAKLGK